MPGRPRRSAAARPPPAARRPAVKLSAAARASVVKILSGFPPRQVERWARQTGFIQRRRQLQPLDFLAVMVFASWAMIAPSLEALAAELEGSFSRVALHYRFTRQASDFLWQCLQWVMAQGQQFQLVLQTQLLKPFGRVLIQDSSSWDLPPALAGVFPGSGGSASPANCKVQLTYEVKRGRLESLQWTAGNRPDQSFRPEGLQAGDLILADLGFFSLRFFAAVVPQRAYFLSRFLIGTQLWSAPTGALLNLPTLLKKASGQAYQHPVWMGGGLSPLRLDSPCPVGVPHKVRPIAHERDDAGNLHLPQPGFAHSHAGQAPVAETLHQRVAAVPAHSSAPDASEPCTSTTGVPLPQQSTKRSLI